MRIFLFQEKSSPFQNPIAYFYQYLSEKIRQKNMRDHLLFPYQKRTKQKIAKKKILKIC